MAKKPVELKWIPAPIGYWLVARSKTKPIVHIWEGNDGKAHVARFIYDKNSLQETVMEESFDSIEDAKLNLAL